MANGVGSRCNYPGRGNEWICSLSCSGTLLVMLQPGLRITNPSFVGLDFWSAHLPKRAPNLGTFQGLTR